MMENKFTPRAEESLRLAQEAAEEMGHGYVGSEHLLLGLMREEEGIAHRVLEEAGLTDDMICDVLHRSVGTGLSGAAPSQGLTPRAKSAVELAVSEASRTGAGYIGTEHLLMGLLREGNNMAIRVLRTVGHRPQEAVQRRGEKDQRSAPRRSRRRQRLRRSRPGGRQEGRHPGGVHPGSDGGRPQRQAGPGHRPGEGDCPGHPDSVPPHQEQPRSDR